MGRSSPDLRGMAVAIRAERERQQLTQTEFGQRYGLTQGQVSKLETATMRELSAPVERAVIRIVGKVLYTGTLSASSARPMHAPEGMTSEETALIFPLIRSALELLRGGKRQEVTALTLIAGTYLKGVKMLEHPEVQQALSASSGRRPSKSGRARSARRKGAL